MLREADKRVVRAFVNEKPLSSNLLETDGVRLDKIGLGGETVAKWVGGRIAIVSTESVKSDESIIRLINSAAGPGVVDFSYARKGHRVHEQGAMGRNGRGIYHETPAGKDDVVIHQDHRGAWRTDLVTSSSGNHIDITGPAKGYSSPFDAFNNALAEKNRRGMVTRGEFWVADSDGNLSEYAADEPMERNGRATVADSHAAHELSLFIENEYSLIGAPNSIGKSIDTNLRRKLANGTYDSSLAPKAWQHLIDEGAKLYTKQFGSRGDTIFSAATRRQVAGEFAKAWEDENRAVATTDKPLASKGLVSYRYRGRYGWVMIGARDDADAIREAERSIDGKATIDRLEIWNGSSYVPTGLSPNARHTPNAAMSAQELARYAIRDSAEYDRAYVVGRKEMRETGREAIMVALEKHASGHDPHPTFPGADEFYGNDSSGNFWRVVVLSETESITGSKHTRNARSVPEHMKGYEDWSYEDFYDDLRNDGFGKRDARLQATRASQAVGKLAFLPPRVPAGWTLGSLPIFRRRDAKPAYEAWKGSTYRVYDLAGKQISPDLKRIRGIIEWRDENGWVAG